MRKVINLKKIPLTIKKSLQYAFSVIAGASTIVGLWGYTLRDINDKLQWWQCGIILLISFVILSVIIFLILESLKHKAYNTTKQYGDGALNKNIYTGKIILYMI